MLAWTIYISFLGAATLLLLPRVKGAVVGAQWAIHRNEGVVAGVDEAASPVHPL